ncbi:serine hydrolase domain-containing protein [Ramlibacter rhizophilus]|uniref:Class A beta-lactamase-related serine hydrolase n=1 Tax=Ramlibacter rhizophilus TaxID=1781167 RepID=A0A4Z0C0P4_9BURK|nr:serine hydrolase domain-containing protein [Ramlibacter rhizophilus]TFZ04374.1 class A beta-lactamase-related serine hydrolase [Ramlibacter rhizophilus]
MSAPHPRSFDAFHAALQSQVEHDFLAGVSTALLRGREVVDRFHTGWADREARVPLREDHLFRVFSNTKLVTSCAVMLLEEEGRLGLDDPVERWLPQLAKRRVLRAGATRIDDTEPAERPITVRQLMTHTSGLSYGVFDPGSLFFAAYRHARVLDPSTDLAAMIDALEPLPLAFQPGTRWEYSVGTDVLARLVEVVSGQSFRDFLMTRIFGPLGMEDTDFWVPPDKRERLCALYASVDLARPDVPGLVRMDELPYPGAYLSLFARYSGGGGLVSSRGDMVKLLQSLIPGGPTLLKPQTLSRMWTNQLPAHLCVQFPGLPPRRHMGFGLGSAVALAPGPGEPAGVEGEVSWGGMAGTVWWIHPQRGTAGVLMTQRWLGTSHAYALEFKRRAYEALG